MELKGRHKGEQEIRQEGGRTLFIQADVSEPAQVESLIMQIVDSFGRFDCAFNNAAALCKTALIHEFSEADFEGEVKSNLRSVWLCMKYELEQVRKQRPSGPQL